MIVLQRTAGLLSAFAGSLLNHGHLAWRERQHHPLGSLGLGRRQSFQADGKLRQGALASWGHLWQAILAGIHSVKVNWLSRGVAEPLPLL